MRRMLPARGALNHLIGVSRANVVDAIKFAPRQDQPILTGVCETARELSRTWMIDANRAGCSIICYAESLKS